MTPARIKELRAKLEAGTDEATKPGVMDFGLAVNLMSTALDELPALLDEVERLREALVDIAEGRFGTPDPLGDGGTYILDGSEYRKCRDRARQALESGQ